jgi:hypothetical protein
VNRPAANNHEFVEAHCVGCSPDGVVERCAAHLPDSREGHASLRLCQRAGERGRLAEVTHHGSVSAWRTLHLGNWSVENVKPCLRVAIVDPPFCMPLPNPVARRVTHRTS